jgi:hypothetical protein
MVKKGLRGKGYRERHEPPERHNLLCHCHRRHRRHDHGETKKMRSVDLIL